MSDIRVGGNHSNDMNAGLLFMFEFFQAAPSGKLFMHMIRAGRDWPGAACADRAGFSFGCIGVMCKRRVAMRC